MLMFCQPRKGLITIQDSYKMCNIYANDIV